MSFSSNASSEVVPANDNKAINDIYHKLSNSFTILDISVIDDIYMNDATYISETQDKEIVLGKNPIIDLYATFFNKIKLKNAKIEVDFRLQVRQYTDGQATDIGYYLMRFHPGEESGEPMSEFAGKFVMVSRKNTQGEWKISVDSNTRSIPKFYYNATPIANLYYGKQYSQKPAQ
ncbi:DUF4440 domain-containing protein [Shewanella aestuarii]|uniref:DUF4440 domain-containing protein n=1 Tax=Shewanella aestuarii TaxID=1028752 RepID=A0A6G9QNM5_9GAMM|nr:DUF4440 domain-containing protein [Shewanella aestuarii]